MKVEKGRINATRQEYCNDRKLERHHYRQLEDDLDNVLLLINVTWWSKRHNHCCRCRLRPRCRRFRARCCHLCRHSSHLRFSLFTIVQLSHVNQNALRLLLSITLQDYVRMHYWYAVLCCDTASGEMNWQYSDQQSMTDLRFNWFPWKCYQAL